MTDQIATTYDPSSLSPELVEDVAEPSGAPSSNGSPQPTGSDLGETGEGAALGGAEEVAGDLPSRLAARMGSEHAAWTFADESDAQAWAAAAFEFCNRFCPLLRKCRGDACRLHRFEGSALAVVNP